MKETMTMTNYAARGPVLTETFELLSLLTGNAADFSLGMRQWHDFHYQTAEFRFDCPDELHLPETVSEENGTADRWERAAVILCNETDFSGRAANVWKFEKHGFAAILYRAFREAIRVKEELNLVPEFLWSSVPLALSCCDYDLLLKKESVMYTQAAVHTFWCKDMNDDEIVRMLKKMSDCGEMRIQNMSTANTWIKESI